MPTLAAVDVIRAKRDGAPLTAAQIEWVIDAYTRQEVAEEQMSALLMAILLNGMTGPEIAAWTTAMIESGRRMDLTGVGRPTVDKHSTGGVGDKISLPLVPLVAACGAAVPQLSGRGLGHTGGTLDKMESIAGWRASLSPREMTDQLSTIGAVICAASEDLAPADRRLYALRDVTATVESIPMIAASIMSKKIAEGTSALVLDVKVGTGAFMKRVDHAAELARTMVELGAREGVRTSALLTDMSTPLGRAVGNAIEVAESVEVLAGGGPADVVELTLALARQMLSLAGLDADPTGGGSWSPRWAATRTRPCRCRDSGRWWWPSRRVSSRPWTRCRWDSRPGDWVPAGPARSTTYRPRPGCCAWPSRASRCGWGSRCSSCTPTPPTSSPRPWPTWTGRFGSRPRVRRSTAPPWCRT
jgi:thymidine phosphorylase